MKVIIDKWTCIEKIALHDSSANSKLKIIYRAYILGRVYAETNFTQGIHGLQLVHHKEIEIVS